MSWKDILLLVLNHLDILVTVIGTGLGLVVGPSMLRRNRVAKGTHIAFLVVEDLAAELPAAKLDKAKEGLKALDDWMKANGWSELTPEERTRVQLEFKAKNAATDAAKPVVAGSPS